MSACQLLHAQAFSTFPCGLSQAQPVQRVFNSNGTFCVLQKNEPEDKPEDGSDVEEDEEQEEYDSEETGTDESGSDTEEQ